VLTTPFGVQALSAPERSDAQHPTIRDRLAQYSDWVHAERSPDDAGHADLIVADEVVY